MSTKFIAWFDEIDKNDIPLVGGKGANLGEMTQAGFPIPFGFVLTSNAYFYFIAETGLEPLIRQILLPVNFEDSKELQDASVRIRRLIEKQPIPEKISTVVTQAYEKLLLKEKKVLHMENHATMERLRSLMDPPYVAVRSSATAEDLPDASFAGQQETFLNVKGESHLLTKIRQAWSSLFTARALYYRFTHDYDHMKVGLAAVVQRMVQSEASGIAFSIDPVTNNRSVLTIEAIFGLGEYVVGGKVTPDHYEVDKKSFTILKKDVHRQTVKLDRHGAGNIEVRLSPNQGSGPKLSDQQIIAVARMVVRIEKHYFFPQDIEWAFETDQLFIVQSRPITTTMSIDDGNSKFEIRNSKLLVKGSPASPGIASGEVVLIFSPNEINKIKKGDILVAPQTNPDYVPAMRRAAGIVTEKGGRTSHAAIVSRELGIPAVVGAEDAIKVLRHEKMVTVNGSSGEVYRGQSLKFKVQSSKVLVPTSKSLKTLMRVYVNLAEPSEAERVARMDVDGVGLLRAEFMIADIGVHPKRFIELGTEREFIDKLSRRLLIFAKAFAPRPIVYRATDFKTNEYRHLKGGEKYEPYEENPMIGLRGASRYIADRKVFLMELAALKRVRESGYKNINLMIPFIRVPKELTTIRSILSDFGLLGLPSFKLLIMVEVPSAVIMLEEFVKIGIDGVSVGTNDLTMLLLGSDRDNSELSHIYDERSPAVMWALKHIGKVTKQYGVTASICGQAPSDYPDLVEKLIDWGFDSVSVNTDAVARVRETIYKYEHRNLWQK